MNYQWLLFDADGTLFDYDRAERMAIQRAFIKHGFEYHPEQIQIYRDINARIWQMFERGEITQNELRSKRFSLLFEALAIEFDPLIFSQTYLQFLGEGHYLIEGAQDLLENLYQKVNLLLITNGLKDVQRSRLQRSTIQPFFADIVISEEVGAAKPDPQIFEVAFQKMGHPAKQNVLIIGDSLTSDIRGGNQYGIDSCWFNPEGRKSDQDVVFQHEISYLHELLPILGFA